MAVRFGTDGIRGRAYDEVSVDLAYRLGRAVAAVFDAPVVVGYDTRESSPVLAEAVLAGLVDGGANATDLGLLPTPGVALIARDRASVGVVVSASHNPYGDNGLKVLGPGGTKLDQVTEAVLAATLEASGPAPADLARDVAVDAGAELAYRRALRALVPGDFSGLHVVLDCANGAASHVAPALLGATGARVSVIHDAPDGRNINDRCGSTDVRDLVGAVRELGADLGLAFDGDADRLIAVDATGAVRDGDDLMVLFALDLATRGELGGGVVVTTMSNLGLRRALAAASLDVVEVDVGDRNVLRALDDRGWSFGGEQSGHLIFGRLASTGDGLLTGLLLVDLVARRGALASLAEAAWRRVPQTLVNVRRDEFDEREVAAMADELVSHYRLGDDEWRLVVRPSGTEPVVRVMVEALEGRFVADFAARLRSVFASAPRGG